MAQTNNPDKPERQDRFEGIDDTYKGVGIRKLERGLRKRMGLDMPLLREQLQGLTPEELDQDELKEMAIDVAGIGALHLILGAAALPGMLLDRDGNYVITMVEAVEFLEKFDSIRSDFRKGMITGAQFEMQYQAMAEMTREQTVDTCRSGLQKLAEGKELKPEDRAEIRQFVSEVMIEPYFPDLPEDAFLSDPNPPSAFLEYKEAQETMKMMGGYMVKVLEEYGQRTTLIGDERVTKAHLAIEAMLDLYEAGHTKGGEFRSNPDIGAFERRKAPEDSSFAILTDLVTDITIKIVEDNDARGGGRSGLETTFQDVFGAIAVNKYLSADSSPYSKLMDMFCIVGESGINLMGGDRSPVNLLAHYVEEGDFKAITADEMFFEEAFEEMTDEELGIEVGEDQEKEGGVKQWVLNRWNDAWQLGKELPEMAGAAYDSTMAYAEEKAAEIDALFEEGGIRGFLGSEWSEAGRKRVLEKSLDRSDQTVESILQGLKSYPKLEDFFDNMLDMDAEVAGRQFEEILNSSLMEEDAGHVWDKRSIFGRTLDSAKRGLTPKGWEKEDDFAWGGATVGETITLLGLTPDKIEEFVREAEKNGDRFDLEFDGKNLARRIWALKEGKEDKEWQRDIRKATDHWARWKVEELMPRLGWMGAGHWLAETSWNVIPPTVSLLSFPLDGSAFLSGASKVVGGYCIMDMVSDILLHYPYDNFKKIDKEGGSAGMAFMSTLGGALPYAWEEISHGDWIKNFWVWNMISGRHPSLSMAAGGTWQGAQWTLGQARTATSKWGFKWGKKMPGGLVGNTGAAIWRTGGSTIRLGAYTLERLGFGANALLQGAGKIEAVQFVRNSKVGKTIGRAPVFAPLSIGVGVQILINDVYYDFEWNPETMQYEPTGLFEDGDWEIDRISDLLIALASIIWGVESIGTFIGGETAETNPGLRGKASRGMRITSRTLGKIGEEKLGLERSRANRTPFSDLDLGRKRVVLHAGNETGALDGSVNPTDRASRVDSVEINKGRKGAGRIVVAERMEYHIRTDSGVNIGKGEHIIVQEVGELKGRVLSEAERGRGPKRWVMGEHRWTQEVTIKHYFVLEDGTILPGENVGYPAPDTETFQGRGQEGEEIKYGPYERAEELKDKVEIELREEAAKKARGKATQRGVTGGERDTLVEKAKEEVKAPDKFESKNIKQKLTQTTQGNKTTYTLEEIIGGKETTMKVEFTEKSQGGETRVEARFFDGENWHNVPEAEVAAIEESCKRRVDGRMGTKGIVDASLDLIEGKVTDSHVVRSFLEIESYIRDILGLEQRTATTPEPVEVQPTETLEDIKVREKEAKKGRRRWGWRRRRRGSTPGDAKQRVNLLGEEDLKRGRKAARDTRAAERRAERIAVDEAVHSPKSEPKPSTPRPVSDPGAPMRGSEPAPRPMPEPPKGPASGESGPTARAADPVRGTASNPVEGPSNVFELRTPEAPKLRTEVEVEGSLARKRAPLPEEVSNRTEGRRGGGGGEPPKGPTNSPLELVADNPGLERTPARGEARLVEPAVGAEAVPEAAPEPKEVKPPLEVYENDPAKFAEGIIERIRARHSGAEKIPAIREMFANLRENAANIIELIKKAAIKEAKPIETYDINWEGRRLGPKGKPMMTYQQQLAVKQIGMVAEVGFMLMYIAGLYMATHAASQMNTEDSSETVGYYFGAGLTGGFAGAGAGMLVASIISHPVLKAAVGLALGFYYAVKGAEGAIHIAQGYAAGHAAQAELLGRIGMVTSGGGIAELMALEMGNSKGDIVNIAGSTVTRVNSWNALNWEKLPVFPVTGDWTSGAVLDHSERIIQHTAVTSYQHEHLPGDIEEMVGEWNKHIKWELGSAVSDRDTCYKKYIESAGLSGLSSPIEIMIAMREEKGDLELLEKYRESVEIVVRLEEEIKALREMVRNTAIPKNLYNIRVERFELEMQQKEAYEEMQTADAILEEYADIVDEYVPFDALPDSMVPGGYEAASEAYFQHLDAKDRFEDLVNQIIAKKKEEKDLKDVTFEPWLEKMRPEHQQYARTVVDMRIEEVVLNDAVSQVALAKSNPEFDIPSHTLWQERYEERLRTQQERSDSASRYMRSAVRAVGFPERVDDLAERSDTYIPNTLEGLFITEEIAERKEKVDDLERRVKTLEDLVSGSLVEGVIEGTREERDLAMAEFERVLDEHIVEIRRKKEGYEEAMESAENIPGKDRRQYEDKLEELTALLEAMESRDPEALVDFEDSAVSEAAQVLVGTEEALEAAMMSESTMEGLLEKLEEREKAGYEDDYNIDGSRYNRREREEPDPWDEGDDYEPLAGELDLTETELRILEMAQEIEVMDIELQQVRTEMAHIMSPYVSEAFFWLGVSGHMGLTRRREEAEARRFRDAVSERKRKEPAFSVNEGYDFEYHELGIDFGYETFEEKYNGVDNIPGRDFAIRTLRHMADTEARDEAHIMLAGHEYLVKDAEYHVRILDKYGVFDDPDQWKLTDVEKEQLRYERAGGVEGIREFEKMEEDIEDLHNIIEEDPEAVIAYITETGELDFNALFADGIIELPEDEDV
ncbi:hypothetical protein HOG48_01875 [Candidatus Peregrinibacteria bacterium]|jgi:hypothetical protein|nr:hypothetical protein [Candidatus Peregrinibacteria bacterium]